MPKGGKDGINGFWEEEDSWPWSPAEQEEEGTGLAQEVGEEEEDDQCLGFLKTWSKRQERWQPRHATVARKGSAAGGGVSQTRGKERACAWVHSTFALGN